MPNHKPCVDQASHPLFTTDASFISRRRHEPHLQPNPGVLDDCSRDANAGQHEPGRLARCWIFPSARESLKTAQRLRRRKKACFGRISMQGSKRCFGLGFGYRIWVKVVWIATIFVTDDIEIQFSRRSRQAGDS
jgi:hypothetical protein